MCSRLTSVNAGILFYRYCRSNACVHGCGEMKTESVALLCLVGDQIKSISPVKMSSHVRIHQNNIGSFIGRHTSVDSPKTAVHSHVGTLAMAAFVMIRRQMCIFRAIQMLINT